MKRLAAIVVIILMLFNSMGYFVVFKTIQYSVKREIKRKIKNQLAASELCLIKVAGNDKTRQAEMQWMEEREFRFQGMMYDVVRTCTQNDTVYFYCINDRQEEQLFARLDHLVKHQTESGPVSRHNSKLIKYIVREAIPESTEIKKPGVRPSVLFAAEIFFKGNDMADVPSPPPKA
jgi:hypothetical protein